MLASAAGQHLPKDPFLGGRLTCFTTKSCEIVKWIAAACKTPPFRRKA